MASPVWFYIFALFTILVIINGVVKIIKASKGSRSKEMQNTVDEMEDDLAKVEQDLEDARNRIEVLEKIVTDDKRNLSREIDDLANRS